MGNKLGILIKRTSIYWNNFDEVLITNHYIYKLRAIQTMTVDDLFL